MEAATPTYTAKPGDNEMKFKRLFIERAGGVALLGKRQFGLEKVKTSVDESFEHNGKDYLIEIDSGNSAKSLVGQYVLLNQLRDRSKQAYFLVVHTYKNYNPMRTLNNLRFVNERLFGGSGIAFGAVHLEALADWNGGVEHLLRLSAPVIFSEVHAIQIEP